MLGVPVTIQGKEYLIRYPMGALIRLERALGWSIMDIRSHKVTSEDMAIIVHHGLHDENGKTIPDDVFEEILEGMSIEEFSELFVKVSDSFNTDKTTSSEKN